MDLKRRRITLQIVVDIVLWFCVALPVLFVFMRGVPVERGFHCDDESLSYPYRPDTISTPVLIVAGFGTSIIVIVFVEVFNCLDGRCRQNIQRKEDIVYCLIAYGVFLVGFVVEELIVETVKNQIGFLRPNFFQVCQPEFNRTLCPGYITKYTCTGNGFSEEDLRDIRQSFPSGHSAFSMYIAVYFCMYIQRRMKVRFSKILKFLMQSGLVFIALLCGLGRIHDNKHHPRDVTVGFIIGTVVAIAVYVTIGSHLLTENESYDFTTKETESTNMAMLSSPTLCCSCSSPVANEPQTPSPLLPYEYQNGTGHFGTATNNNTKLRDIPFSIRRPISSPVTQTRHTEDV